MYGLLSHPSEFVSLSICMLNCLSLFLILPKTATTSPPPVTTQTTPAKVAKINLAFSITQAFKDIYSNLSDPETKILSNNITSVVIFFLL